MLFCKVNFSKSRAKVQYLFHIRKRACKNYPFPSIFTQQRDQHTFLCESVICVNEGRLIWPSFTFSV